MTKVAIVPHTHWDREWYATFESFRGRLIDLLDELLPLIEGDPSYAHFLLDGQLAVVDDYLAIRPENEERLRRLVGAGRVAVGPWYTLPDEFCVSGETLVRNLQLGLARAAKFGGAMNVGYLPDMFGHVAQMPQILRLAGFDRAVVWRGVPHAVDRTTFRWSALDGSSVLAEYLWEGYGNGSDIPDDAKALVQRIRSVLDAQGEARYGDLLVMNGTDHERPQPWLGRVVAEANELADDLDIRITSLAAVLASRSPDADLPAWTGELRSGARANLLMGVASNRVDVKQAAALAERSLERIAEPLCALWSPTWPEALLADAWREVIRNAAHDSSCACSIDEVCDAVLTRYRSASSTARSLTRRALRSLAASVASPGLLVVNPTARTRGGVLELEFPGAVPGGDAQVIASHPAVVEDRVLPHDEALAWLAGWRSQDLGSSGYTVAVTITDGDPVSLVLHAEPYLRTNLVVPVLRDEVRELLGSAGELHLRIEQEPRCRVVCRVEDIPGFGFAYFPAAPLQHPPVTVAGSVLSNDLVRVDAGFVTLSEAGDYGDTYNYCPPDVDAVVESPRSRSLTVLEAGPVRARVAVDDVYDWPSHVEGGRRVGTVPTTVRTVVELRAGEPWVRISHAWDNQSRDHRVRAVVPCHAPVSHAECAFGVVTRGTSAEGGPTEQPLATFPSRRFVQAGDVTIVHDGLLEYELLPSGLALTLLRGTGMLSRPDLPMRPQPAGPPIAVPGAQLQGPFSCRYAVAFEPGIDPYAMADDVLIDLLTVRAPGGGSVAAERSSALVVDDAVVSAVLRDGPSLIVRVFNPTAAAVNARIVGRAGWIVDLRGRPIRPFEETVALEPWQMATLHLPSPPSGLPSAPAPLPTATS